LFQLLFENPVLILFHLSFQFQAGRAKGHADDVLRVGTHPHLKNSNCQVATITVFGSLTGEVAMMVNGLILTRRMRWKTLPAALQGARTGGHESITCEGEIEIWFFNRKDLSGLALLKQSHRIVLIRSSWNEYTENARRQQVPGK
jgi:hypothetical protein